jgi:hypothetical protein
MDTLTDPRTAAWQRRRIEIDRLGTLRVFRGSCCGCSRCRDAERIEELDSLIKQTLERIAVLTDRCSTRLVPVRA